MTQTELRVVFKEPPRLPGFGLDRSHRPGRDQLVVKFDPGTGVRLLMEARRTDAQDRSPSRSTWSSPTRAAKRPRL